APYRRTGFDLGAYGRGHGEYARIAARYHSDICALGGTLQRRGGSCLFFAIVGGMPRLAGPDRHLFQVGAVAVDGFGVCQRRIGLRGEPAGIPGSEPDDGEATTHGRPSHPATSTVAK